VNDTRIEWASLNMPGGGYTWNPIVGCTANCSYCYARGAAPRVARQVAKATGTEPCPDCLWFWPHLHAERLGQPASKRRPSGIFVGSMCDLYGNDTRLVEWREQVFSSMSDAPWHRYAILTKQPDWMYMDPYLPKPPVDTLTGVSVACAPDVWRIGALKCAPTSNLRGVSFEPLQGMITRERLEFELHGIDWAIIGAETGKRRGRVVPEWAWVAEIVSACDALGVPVFLKDNLKPYAPDGYVWRQEWPEVWA
jgi:protein gp37